VVNITGLIPVSAIGIWNTTGTAVTFSKLQILGGEILIKQVVDMCRKSD
jgi:hypothetical protein